MSYMVVSLPEPLESNDYITIILPFCFYFLEDKKDSSFDINLSFLNNHLIPYKIQLYEEQLNQLNLIKTQIENNENFNIEVLKNALGKMYDNKLELNDLQ